MAAPVLLKNIDHEDISVVVKDGTGTPVTLTLNMEDASLNWGELPAGGILQSLVLGKRRGKMRSAHRGERVEIPFTLTGKMVSVDGLEFHNFILKREGYAANVSTLGTGQKIYTIDVDINFAESNWGGTDTIMTLKQVYFTVGFAEQDNAEMQVSYNGTVLGEILVPGSDPMGTERA